MNAATLTFARNNGRPRRFAFDSVLLLAVSGIILLGLVMMTSTTLGSMTPPVGVAMFTVCGLLKTPLDEYTKEAIPLILAVVTLIFAMAFVPEIVLFLPNLLM